LWAGICEEGKKMNSSQNARILYVDDNDDACEMIRILFAVECKGYEIFTATSAIEAYEQLNNQQFNLIILNYYLPEMSGVEFCRRIRKSDSQIPLMFYSAMSREVDCYEALAAGANAFLVKPNDLDILTETVKRLLAENSLDSENETSIETKVSNNSY
jgi:DNA-binding response OmpR family regulator